MDRRYIFPPLTLPFFIFLFTLPFLFFSFMFAIVSVGRALGFSALQILLILYASLIGSIINIPIKEFEHPVKVIREYSFFGIRYRIPVIHSQRTVLAVNVGGAVIPVIVALYLLISSLLPHIQIFLLAFFIVTAASYAFAKVIKGVGIIIPAFLPPLFASIASLIAVLQSPQDFSIMPKIAFTSGVFGVLFGADILNMRKVIRMGAPIVSIGGAGVFDGIFLTGFMSAMLALLFM